MAEDFKALTVVPEDGLPEPGAAWTFSDMLKLTEITYNLFRGLQSFSPEGAAAARTSVGKLIGRYMAADPVSAFPGSSRLYLMNRCPGAEKTLLKSIADENVSDPDDRSPVIVMSEGKRVGVMKSKGNRYIYGLDDDFGHSLLAMAFSAPQKLARRADFPPPAPHAWYVEADKLEPIVPLRLSVLAIEASQRPSMRGFSGEPEFDDDECAQQVTSIEHTEIQAQVDRLLEVAKPLDLSLAGLNV